MRFWEEMKVGFAFLGIVATLESFGIVVIIRNFILQFS